VLGGLFGDLQSEHYWDWIFELCYTQDGGSGLSFSLSDVDVLPMSRIHWFVEKLNARRSAEHEAKKKAYAKK